MGEAKLNEFGVMVYSWKMVYKLYLSLSTGFNLPLALPRVLEQHRIFPHPRVRLEIEGGSEYRIYTVYPPFLDTKQA